MTDFLEINLFDSIAVLIAAAIPIYLSFYVQGSLRILTVLLSIFVLIHALYHILEVFEYEDIADTIILPLSILLLIVFGLVYLRIRNLIKVST